MPAPISAITQTAQCHTKCRETQSRASRLLLLSSHRQSPEPKNDTNKSLRTETQEKAHEQSLSWTGDSRQITCFSSPYLAQSSPQTPFQLVTTTTFKVLAWHPFIILAVQTKSQCVFCFYLPLPPRSLPERKSACNRSYLFQAQVWSLWICIQILLCYPPFALRGKRDIKGLYRKCFINICWWQFLMFLENNFPFFTFCLNLLCWHWHRF